MLSELTTMMLMLVASAASVPADAAENAPAPPAGRVLVPPPNQQATLEATMQAMRADAAQRSGLDASRLVVQPAESVTWSDGSMGCPQPGRMYTQALVPGWRVRIQAGDQTLHYHASRGGNWIFCPAGRVKAPLPSDATR